MTVDDESYEAGAGGIVVITIRNPFELPVKVLELKQPRSSLLDDVPRRVSRVSRAATRGWLGRIREALTPAMSVVSARLFFGGITAKFGAPDKNLVINAEKDLTIDLGDISSDFNTIVINAKEGANIVTNSRPKQQDELKLVQPHCEINAYLILDTRGWLLFKPTRLRLKSEIRYQIDGDEREFSQVVSLNFDVKPPLRAVLIGAMAGATLGGIARFVRDLPRDGNGLNITGQQWVMQAIQLGGAVIMSVIAAVALSRKSGAQGFITVEDFFGGFVVGVLVSYEGPSYFEDVLKQVGGAGAPAAGAGAGGGVAPTAGAGATPLPK